MRSSRIENMLGNSVSGKTVNRDPVARRYRRNEQVLKNAVRELQESVRNYKDLYVRQIAEMENFAKAKEREISIISRNASREIMKNLLPFIDSLESASRSGNTLDGVNSLKNQMVKILSTYGFKEIESVGRRFDPYLHEAIGLVESENDDLVVEEVQKGYMLKDEVLRTAKVLVGRRK